MELAGAGDDVFSRLLDGTLDHGVGLGEPLQTCRGAHIISFVTLAGTDPPPPPT